MAEPLPAKDIDKTDASDVADVESSTTVEAAVVPETARVLDHQAEVKLCRKFDMRILPILALMCKWKILNLLRNNLQQID